MKRVETEARLHTDGIKGRVKMFGKYTNVLSLQGRQSWSHDTVSVA